MVKNSIMNLRVSPCLRTGFFLNTEHISTQSSFLGSIVNLASPNKIRTITTAPEGKESYQFIKGHKKFRLLEGCRKNYSFELQLDYFLHGHTNSGQISATLIYVQ